MNVTFLNSTEEVVRCLFLCRTTVSVCAYAIFLCYAIYDYQDEKPTEEKKPCRSSFKRLYALWILVAIP